MTAQTCRTCGAINAAGVAACFSCGQPLAGAPGPVYGAPPPSVASPPGYPPPYGAPFAGPYGYPQLYPQPYGQPYGVPFGVPYAPAYPGYVMYQPAFLMPVTPQARMASLVQSVRTARAGAAVLDALAVLGIWALLFFFVYPPIFGDPFRFNPFNNLQFRLPITLFTVLSYYALQDAFGGTLAKRAMSLRVVNINFRPIGVGRGYARSCELLITIMMGFLGVIGAVVWIIVQSGMISRDGQSTGDKAGACWVVRTSDIPAG